MRLAAEKAKSLEGPKLALAMEDMELPPDVALQPGKILYRKGDHELMPNIFVGDVHPPDSGNPDNMFTVASVVPGEKAAGPVADTGCKMVHPGLTPTPLNRPNSEGRPMLQVVLFNVTNGLIIGAFYVLMALGLSLILNLSATSSISRTAISWRSADISPSC